MKELRQVKSVLETLLEEYNYLENKFKNEEDMLNEFIYLIEDFYNDNEDLRNVVSYFLNILQCYFYDNERFKKWKRDL